MNALIVRLISTVHWLALAMWFAALITAGIAALNVFGTLRDMPMSLDAYESVESSQHGLLAAGHVMDGVFFSVDLVQFVVAPAALLTMIALLIGRSLGPRSVANILRCALIVIAAGVFGYYAWRLAPDLNHHLHARWEAARAGDLELARSHVEAFEPLHKQANLLMQINLFMLLGAIGLGAWASAHVRDDSAHARRNKPAEPMLATKAHLRS